MAIPERDTVYNADGTERTVYTRESNATGWFVGIIVVLALLAIGYLVFSANSVPTTTINNTPAVTTPMVDTTPAPVTEAPATTTTPMTTAPATETAPAAPADSPAMAPAAPAAPVTP